MHEWQVWLVAALLLFVAEMLAPGFWLLSFAVGCLAAGVVSLVAPGAVVPALTFAGGTLLCLVGIRPFLLRHLHPRGTEIRTNVDALAGRVGIVSERIDPATGKGRCWWKVRVGPRHRPLVQRRNPAGGGWWSGWGGRRCPWRSGTGHG